MTPRISGRLAFVGVLIVALFAALFTRLWYLQVLTAEDLEIAAEANRIELVIEPPARGRIVDRHGRVLADNRRDGIVTLDRSRLTTSELDETLEALSGLLGISEATLSSRLDDISTHRLAPKIVATGLDETALHLIEERSLPGVEARWALQRTYPYGHVGAHVLGYVGAMSDTQFEDLVASGYLPSERVGRAGVEALFEEELHGEPGLTTLEVDSGSRVHRIVSTEPGTPGHDVVLTIDIDLQNAVESFLLQGLRGARKEVSPDSGFFFPAPAGAAVVMDVRSGELLAMASYPTFDPNWLIEGMTDTDYESVFDNPYYPGPLNNRAIQGLYAPGSVFKLMTALAGLEAGIVSPRATFNDLGYFTIPAERNCVGRCTFFNAGRKALGPVDLSAAVTRSSDAFFYRVGHDLYWLDSEEQYAIQEVSARFGFGEPTGVQLPFEKAGRMATPDVKRDLYNSDAAALYNPYEETDAWLPGDNINAAIGQGFVAATPLQIVNAYATFANGGSRLQPNIVSELVSRDPASFGETVREFGPRLVDQIDFPAGHSVVLEGLTGVPLKSRFGTAGDAFIDWDHASWGIVGKTGTSEADGLNSVLQRPKEDTAVFAAWAPRHDPRYAVVVVMEESGFGGDNAAPVARRIFEALRAYEQQWPDPEVNFVAPQPECPVVPEALRGDPAFLPFVPEGCPWGTQVPRANTADDADGDGVPDLEEQQ